MKETEAKSKWERERERIKWWRWRASSSMEGSYVKYVTRLPGATTSWIKRERGRNYAGSGENFDGSRPILRIYYSVRIPRDVLRRKSLYFLFPFLSDEDVWCVLGGGGAICSIDLAWKQLTD